MQEIKMIRVLDAQPKEKTVKEFINRNVEKLSLHLEYSTGLSLEDVFLYMEEAIKELSE